MSDSRCFVAILFFIDVLLLGYAVAPDITIKVLAVMGCVPLFMLCCAGAVLYLESVDG